MRGWGKIFHANENDREKGIAIFLSDKIAFKTKAIKKEKEGHYIVIKGSIQGEAISLINTYAPNIGVSRYRKQILTDIKGETDEYTMIVGDFNTLLTSKVKSFRQKISKAIEILNNTTE